MWVVFRYDDLAADPAGFRDSDGARQKIWEAEQRMDCLFQQYGMSYVAGIIPRAASSAGTAFNDDREKLEFVRQGVAAGRIEAAQHGYAHVNHVWKTHPGHRQGEFRKRGYEAQFKDMVEGKRILVEECGFTSLKTFIPPWNGWDRNTALAMKKSGFEILSGRAFEWYPEAKDLIIIPKTATLQELESLLADDKLPHDGTVVVIYHPTDIVASPGNASASFGVERLGRVLNALARKPHARVVTFSQLANETSDLTPRRFQSAVRWHKVYDFVRGLVPAWWLPGWNTRLFYCTEAEYSSDTIFGAVLAFAILLCFVVAGTGAGWVVRHAIDYTRREWIIGFCFVVIGLCLLAQWHLVHKGYHMTIKRFVPACVALGFAAGLL